MNDIRPPLLSIFLILIFTAACASPTPAPTTLPPVGSTAAATSAPRTRQPLPPRTAAVTPTPAPSEYLKIVFLLSSFEGERQQQFKQLLIENTRGVTGTVRIESADNDANQQRAQVEAALDQGAPVLVIQPVDPDSAASFVDAAHKASAKVIAFDRLINTRDLDAYVSHDFAQVGQLQAQAALDWLAAKGIKAPYNFVFIEGAAGDPTAAGITRGYRRVLDPFIAKNQVKLAADEAVADWSAGQALAAMQTVLTKTKNNVHAVLANSSTLARGAALALDAHKLTGKVFLAGADGDLENLRALCAGTLNLEIIKDDTRLATTAAQLAAAVADDRLIGDNPLINDATPLDDRKIPHAAIRVKPVTLDSIQAQLVQTDQIAASELERCFPPLPPGATVPTTTVASSITLWTEEKTDSPLYQYLANLAAQFAAANRGATIKLVSLEPQALRESFTRGAASEAPTLLWVTNEEVRRLAAAQLLQAADAFSPTLFVDSALAAATFAGTPYGIPISTGDNLLLYYNKKLIKEPPANTDALVRLAPTLTKGDQWTLVYDQTDPFWLIPWIGGYKGSLFASNSISPTLYTSATVDALNLLKTFRDKKVAPPTMDNPTADALFQEGKAALIINGDEALSVYLARLGADLGVTRLPQVSKGDLPRPYTGGTYFAIPRNISGDQLQVARTFARFVTAKAIQIDLARKFRRLPALQEALNDAAITGDPLLKGMTDQMRLGLAPPDAAALTCVWEAIKPAMQAVLSDKATPADAAKAMQTSAEVCIAKLP